MNVLVTGATGYIGGRLIPRLLADGHRVRVLVRDPARIQLRPWAEQVEVHVGDALDAETLRGVGAGIDAAYYLVHSMGAGPDFRRLDLEGACNFASEVAGVPHTIYLGGLLPSGPSVSDHLRSRAEVGEVLRDTLPATELRAGPIIGSGSASFEMVRYLTERLPAMVAPRWILNEVQPIAIRDVLAYLLRALSTGPAGVVEIGADRLTFKRMMEVYAEVRGLGRRIVPLPVLAPALAARWVGLVTPIPNRLAVPLVEGIVHPVVADTSRARALWPEVTPIPYRQAVERALERTVDGEVPTRWSNALGGSGGAPRVTDWEGSIREIRTVPVNATPARVFEVVSGLGGDGGWLVWDAAWQLRGALDRLVGGPGLRRGRRHPRVLLPGDAVDFWRVEKSESPTLLRLRAEMKVPGAAWLEWQMKAEDGHTRLVQVAHFAPRGLAGALYWYALYPLHRRIFSDLARAIARRAESRAGA